MAAESGQRVLIKLSGEALGSADRGGIDREALGYLAGEVATLSGNGRTLGIVVGAGNIIRGRHLSDCECIDPHTADYMGMAATAINALALRDTLEHAGLEAAILSAIDMPLLVESYSRRRMREHLQAGRVVIFAGGTSHPGVTTDMCAAIRANDMDADLLLKATKVDGVFDKDPARFDDATKFDTLTYQQAIASRLGVMDLPAMAFCLEHRIPMRVVDLFQAGSLLRACQGDAVGTYVSYEGQ